MVKKKTNRDHWMQRITFAVETTNAADTHTQRDRRWTPQYLLRSQSDGEGKYISWYKSPTIWQTEKNANSRMSDI